MISQKHKNKQLKKHKTKRHLTIIQQSSTTTSTSTSITQNHAQYRRSNIKSFTIIHIYS